MPQSNVRSTIVRGPLQNISIQYKNNAFVADQVFPILNVDSPKSKIWKWDTGSMFRNEAGYRAPGGEARRTGMTGSWVNLTTKEYALAAEVTVEDRKFARLQGAPDIQPDTDAVQIATNGVDLKKELLIASTILTGTWKDGNSGGEDAAGLWAATDSTNTMLTDVQTAFRTIAGTIGNQPGLRKCMLIDNLAVDKIVEAFVQQDTFKYTSGGKPSIEWLQNFIGVDELIIGSALYDAGNEKKAGGQNTITPIWQITATKGFAFCFVKPVSLGLKTIIPGLQARLMYGADEGGGARRVTMWPEESKHQDVYEVAEETAITQVCSDAGYLFKDIILT